MNITILQSYDPAFRPLAELALPNVAAYAAKHGYNHVVNTRRLVNGRHPSWDKVALAMAWTRFQGPGDWALVLDVDAVFLNMDKPLTDLIPGDRDYSLIVCADGPDSTEHWHFNAGAMMIQATDISRCLLEEVSGANHHHNSPNWEQEAFQERAKVGSVLTKNGGWTTYAGQIHRYANHLEFNHRGPFIHHFCGCGSVEERVKLMKEELNGAFGKTAVCEGPTPTGDS